MKLIVGLGNPGAEYENTRHNAGFMVLDELARRHAGGAVARGRFHAATLECMIGNEKVLLAKPTTFMNKSGLSVGEALRFYKLEPAEDMLVIVDDLYLPLGAIRMKPKGGDGGHNGLADVARAAGGDAYARLRLGVDSKPPGASQAGYVLGRFTQEQSDALQPALKQAADAAECWVKHGLAEAMNRFNTPEEKKAKGAKPKSDQSCLSQ
jgi:PTH1 family peptidyl-tRNA hydrolase